MLGVVGSGNAGLEPGGVVSIESQNIVTIGAQDWHANTGMSYIGSAKKIGIIDAGFKACLKKVKG